MGLVETGQEHYTVQMEKKNSKNVNNIAFMLAAKLKWELKQIKNIYSLFSALQRCSDLID